MKKLMMIVALVAATVSANAQNINREVGSFTLQPKVGMSMGSFSGDYAVALPVGAVGSKTTFETKTRLGLTAGVEAEYYAAEWFGVALGVNYAMEGYKYEYSYSEGGISLDEKGTDKLDYINLPLVANFYVAKGLALKTGVQLGFLVNAKNGNGIDIKDGCKKTSFKIPVGLSYEFSNFVIDARYNIPLTKFVKKEVAESMGQKDNWKNGTLTLTIGYKFEL